MAGDTNAGVPTDDGEQAPGGRHKRAFIWIGAVVTIVGTVGSLIFGAITAYLNYRVSVDQLEQSEEEDEQRIRDQASKITVWVEGRDGSGKQRLHLMNRSLAPVHTFRVALDSSYVKHSKVVWTWYHYDAGTIPPCTTYVIPADGFALSSDSQPRTLTFMKPVWYHFEDGQYRDWLNTGSKLLSESSNLGAEEDRLTDKMADETGSLIATKQSKESPADCV